MRRLIFLILFCYGINLEKDVLGQSIDCLAPVIEPKGQFFLCDGGSIKLQTSPSSATFQWFRDGVAISGATNNFLTITEEGAYTLTASNEGCVASSETSIIKRATNYTTPQVKILTDGNLRFCDGEYVELQVEGNFSDYYWSTGERTAKIVVDQPGDYSVEAFIGDCSVFGEVTVTAMTTPVIEITASDSIFQLGQPIELLATGAQDILWFPSDGLSGTMISNPTALPSKTTTYYVTGVSANGCRDTTSITLYLDERHLNLTFPKVFSPNNDGTDDYWVIKNIEAYPTCELTVFNRQGIEVLKTKPYHNDWNGIYKGNPLPEGDYYYVMQCGGKEKVKTGSVMLVR